jgi:hypothetical protein
MEQRVPWAMTEPEEWAPRDREGLTPEAPATAWRGREAPERVRAAVRGARREEQREAWREARAPRAHEVVTVFPDEAPVATVWRELADRGAVPPAAATVRATQVGRRSDPEELDPPAIPLPPGAFGVRAVR